MRTLIALLVIMITWMPQTRAEAMLFEVTAYCIGATCGGRGAGLTDGGIYGIPYLTCAADGYPFGTVFRLPEGREFICHDRIGHGCNDHIDLYLDNVDECMAWGRQYVMVEVMER